VSLHTQHVRGGAVIVAAIIGETKILLIKETTKPTPHYFKLVSETLLEGEPILNALCRGVAEEAGLKDLKVREVNGQVVEIIDPRLTAVKQLIPSHMLVKPSPHRRHFWGLMTTDEVIMSLSGKHLTGDVNEEIDTMAFDLSELEKMVDLLPKHRELINQITQGVPA
jgi:ADP-ribose pyrophosphatase YjhB (NUDIX family)